MNLSRICTRGVLLSLLGALAAGALPGCSIGARDEPAALYQPEPTYQQPVTYYTQPQPQPPVVYEQRRYERSPTVYAMEQLRQADRAIQAGDMRSTKDSLRSARDLLANAPRDRRSEEAFGRINEALDAANHSRPRITQDRIEDAMSVLHESLRYEASGR